MGILLGIELIYTVAVLIKKHYVEDSKIIHLIIIAGFIMRIGYMLYTGCNVRGHDVLDFNTVSGGHAAYILTILQTGKLPAANYMQFYQQPFFYLSGSLLSRFINCILSCNDPYYLVDAAKLISCIASCLTVLVSESLIKVCNITREGHFFVIIYISFLPAFYLSGGRITPDSLIAFIMTLILYYTIKWQQEPSFKSLVILAFLFGIGMMTKLSCAVIAIFTAFFMIRELISSLRKKQAYRCLLQYAIFCIISFPLGLWYSLRNYLNFHQSFSYVPKIGNDSPLYIGSFSLVERFFSINFSNMFTSPYASVLDDYNLPIYHLKSSLFGEFYYSVAGWIPTILLFSTFIIMVSFVVSILWQWIYNSTDSTGNILTAIIILFYGSLMLFCLKYSFGCSLDFRYALFIVIPASILFGKYFPRLKNHILKSVIIISTFLFSLTSCLMYTLIR